MTVGELKEYATKRGLNLGQAEKDYYQNVLLFILYQRTGKELVFKGGTALAKCYGLNRFSEDLDFTSSGEAQALYEQIVNPGLDSFGIPKTVSRTSYQRRSSIKVKLEGPLYKGTEKTLCSITVELSSREKVLMEPNIITIGHHMDIIPTFDVYVMKEEEIMAEKTKAVMTRLSARDLYDVCFLIKKGVQVDRKTIDKKLEIVDMTFDRNAFAARCSKIKTIWNSELKSLVRNVPDFNDCLKPVLDFFAGK